MNLQKIGAFAFLVGVLMSIIFGLIPGISELQWIYILLIILGIVVGILNISDKNLSLFLLAVLTFIATSTSLNMLPIIGTVIRNINTNLLHFLCPAALVVSVIAIIRVANAK
ncbi:MAG TPA: hypothetical protein P5513_02030 [Candidatus Diapherotrites archaeon]|jgi:hypothetical protein|nr:hypothetical protein [Candidatus Diapherotrites archaeon]